MGFFYFLLFIFLTRTVAGQWRHNLAVPPTHTQAPPLACPHTPSRRASPCRRRNRDRTDPVACTSATCSRRRPDAATTATTRTAAPPIAAAGPTPTRKHLDKFFCFCFFLLISTWQDNGGHITAVIPTSLARMQASPARPPPQHRHNLSPPPPQRPPVRCRRRRHSRCPHPPCIPWHHLPHHPYYTSTRSIYLFKCHVYHLL